MQIHEDEYPRESARLHGSPLAANRTATGNPEPSQAADSTHARDFRATTRKRRLNQFSRSKIFRGARDVPARSALATKRVSVFPAANVCPTRCEPGRLALRSNRIEIRPMPSKTCSCSCIQVRFARCWDFSILGEERCLGFCDGYGG